MKFSAESQTRGMEVRPTFDMIPATSAGGCALCHAPWADASPDNDGDHISVVALPDGTGLWHASCFFSIYTNDPNPELDFLHSQSDDGADDASSVSSADELCDDGSGQA